MANSNKEFEIPFIDNFIHKIDLPGRRLEIVTPEYIDVDQGN
jgi:ribosomal 30S subunit maturation factor RimM